MTSRSWPASSARRPKAPHQRHTPGSCPKVRPRTVHPWSPMGAQPACLPATLPALNALLRSLPEQAPGQAELSGSLMLAAASGHPAVHLLAASHATRADSPSQQQHPPLPVCCAPGVRPVRDRIGFGEQRLAGHVVEGLVAHIADLILCKARPWHGSETGRCNHLPQAVHSIVTRVTRPAGCLGTAFGVSLDCDQGHSCA